MPDRRAPAPAALDPDAPTPRRRLHPRCRRPPHNVAPGPRRAAGRRARPRVPHQPRPPRAGHVGRAGQRHAPGGRRLLPRPRRAPAHRQRPPRPRPRRPGDEDRRRGDRHRRHQGARVRPRRARQAAHAAGPLRPVRPRRGAVAGRGHHHRGRGPPAARGPRGPLPRGRRDARRGHRAARPPRPGVRLQPGRGRPVRRPRPAERHVAGVHRARRGADRRGGPPPPAPRQPGAGHAPHRRVATRQGHRVRALRPSHALAQRHHAPVGDGDRPSRERRVDLGRHHRPARRGGCRRNPGRLRRAALEQRGPAARVVGRRARRGRRVLPRRPGPLLRRRRGVGGRVPGPRRARAAPRLAGPGGRPPPGGQRPHAHGHLPHRAPTARRAALDALPLRRRPARLRGARADDDGAPRRHVVRLGDGGTAGPTGRAHRPGVAARALRGCRRAGRAAGARGRGDAGRAGTASRPALQRRAAGGAGADRHRGTARRGARGRGAPAARAATTPCAPRCSSSTAAARR